MILLLGLLFWITAVGANYPSRLLSELFEYIKVGLVYVFDFFNAPDFIKRLFYKRNIHDTQLGGCGNVAANGDIFPTVCADRGLWLFTEDSV